MAMIHNSKANTSISAATYTRLEKVAFDNGFDQARPKEGIWLTFISTQAPLHLWLTVQPDGFFLAAFSQAHVAKALVEHGSPITSPLPTAAHAARAVADIPALHRMVRRAFQLSRTLPDELLHSFENQTAALPRKTEAERRVVMRVGQDIFRRGLLDYWQGRCAVTGLSEPELLRSSHIKPWSKCKTDKERLDVFNGFLLAPHLDLAFDRGFITFADDRTLVLSPQLSEPDRAVLGLLEPLRVRALADGHRRYLSWHRENVFKDSD